MDIPVVDTVFHYPITIVKSRYGGTYEGGKWLAFNCDPWHVPEQPFSDDVTCMTWWDEHKDEVGRGDTPDAAFENLCSIPEPGQAIWNPTKRIHEWGRKPWMRYKSIDWTKFPAEEPGDSS